MGEAEVVDVINVVVVVELPFVGGRRRRRIRCCCIRKKTVLVATSGGEGVYVSLVNDYCASAAGGVHRGGVVVKVDYLAGHWNNYQYCWLFKLFCGKLFTKY